MFQNAANRYSVTWSLLPIGHNGPLFHSRMIRPVLGARASRPHPVPLVAAELQCDAAGSHPVGGNRIGQAEGEPWRRSRLIQVGEMAEAVPGLVRAGRPRSQEAKPSSHDIVTPRAQNCRSILVPLVVEAGPSVFWSICVYSCPFVVHLHDLITIGRFSSNDPHGGAGARLTAISKPWPTLSPGLA